MDNQEAHVDRPAYPVLSISKPPPRRERVMTYVLSSLFAGAALLGLAGMVAHWLHLR
ncbi:MAG: hypothetical protein JWN04_4462 [Myxococcaceae bacterium]|nr:hypothetical protein [Myxococcaceae bacterium]